MAAYRRVYDSRHLQADCQEPGSAPEPYARHWSMATFSSALRFLCKNAPYKSAVVKSNPLVSTAGESGRNRERKCADTNGTVLVPWVGRFQCCNINIFFK